jgi:hypothetical protein
MPSDDASTEQSSPSASEQLGQHETDESGAGTDTAADSADETDESPEETVTATDDGKSRDVVVPMRVYKAVTVFTTLFAVATVVGGFILLDLATDTGQAPVEEINVVVALAGIGLVVAGAAAYAYSTRFRTEGMGKSKDDTDEDSDNG